MKWDFSTGSLALTTRDITVLEQCGHGLNELKNTSSANRLLPPLWSVLSYELLRCPSLSAPFFWEQYRHSRTLAAERDSHYSAARIPKNTFGMRKLFVPDEQIAMHQRFILSEILNHIPVSEHAFAYRKGVSIRDCAAPHANQHTLIHLDIQNFFSTITEKAVFKALEKETGYSKQLVDFISKLCCHHGRLPQGACTSPALSNICFRACDDALAAFAQNNGLVYTRYSDDLFFSGTIENAAVLVQRITVILFNHGFRFNRSKTRILHQNAAQRILGLVVNERVQVSRAYRRDLRQELYYLHKYRESALAGRPDVFWSRYLSRVQGKIAYVLSIDPDNAYFLNERQKLLALIDESESL